MNKKGKSKKSIPNTESTVGILGSPLLSGLVWLITNYDFVEKAIIRAFQLF